MKKYAILTLSLGLANISYGATLPDQEQFPRTAAPVSNTIVIMDPTDIAEQRFHSLDIELINSINKIPEDYRHCVACSAQKMIHNHATPETPELLNRLYIIVEAYIKTQPFDVEKALNTITQWAEGLSNAESLRLATRLSSMTIGQINALQSLLSTTLHPHMTNAKRLELIEKLAIAAPSQWDNIIFPPEETSAPAGGYASASASAAYAAPTAIRAIDAKTIGEIFETKDSELIASIKGAAEATATLTHADPEKILDFAGNVLKYTEAHELPGALIDILPLAQKLYDPALWSTSAHRHLSILFSGVGFKKFMQLAPMVLQCDEKTLVETALSFEKVRFTQQAAVLSALIENGDPTYWPFIIDSYLEKSPAVRSKSSRETPPSTDDMLDDNPQPIQPPRGSKPVNNVIWPAGTVLHGVDAANTTSTVSSDNHTTTTESSAPFWLTPKDDSLPSWYRRFKVRRSTPPTDTSSDGEAAPFWLGSTSSEPSNPPAAAAASPFDQVPTTVAAGSSRAAAPSMQDYSPAAPGSVESPLDSLPRGIESPSNSVPATAAAGTSRASIPLSSMTSQTLAREDNPSSVHRSSSASSYKNAQEFILEIPEDLKEVSSLKGRRGARLLDDIQEAVAGLLSSATKDANLAEVQTIIQEELRNFIEADSLLEQKQKFLESLISTLQKHIN